MTDDATTADLYKQLLGLARPIDYTNMFTSPEVTKLQTTVGVLERFSVAETISAVGEEIREVEQNNPDKRFIVMMRTPDGRMMQIQSIKARGFSTYIAEGWIDEMKCKVAGHASTLSVFIAIEDKESKKPVGFKFETPATAPQPESEPSAPDKKLSDQ